jgi:hypothetical protein
MHEAAAAVEASALRAEVAEARVTDILHRVELHGTDQGREVMVRNFLPWCGEQLKQGRELVIEARLLDDDITDKQRGYLHGGVLTQISKEAVANGQHFPMEVWKEWYRATLLGFKVVTSIDPFTLKKKRKRVRISTEDLGVRGMAEYIDRVIAHASTEQVDKNGDNLTIRPPLTKEVRDAMRRYAKREWVDEETGEVMECT